MNPIIFFQNLEFESFEAEKSDVENEKIGQKLEKLSKKFVVDLKNLQIKSPAFICFKPKKFDKEKPNFESEYLSLQDGRSMNSEIISESEISNQNYLILQLMEAMEAVMK